MNSILYDIIKDINDKIEKLNQEKLELTFILDSNSIVEEKVGDYFGDLKCKFNELLSYIDLKIEVCESKKNKYEDNLRREHYNTWLIYIERKKQYINNLTETLGNTDLLSMTELEDIVLSETNETENINLEIYKEKGS